MSDTDLDRLPGDVALLMGWYCFSAYDGEHIAFWRDSTDAWRASPWSIYPVLFDAALNWCLDKDIEVTFTRWGGGERGVLLLSHGGGGLDTEARHHDTMLTWLIARE